MGLNHMSIKSRKPSLYSQTVQFGVRWGVSGVLGVGWYDGMHTVHTCCVFRTKAVAQQSGAW